jgi:hypothetical protein
MQILPSLRLEPNDNRSLRKLRELPDGASTIAHNPRKRGDGVLAESSTGRSQEKGTCEMQVPFSWGRSTKMQLNYK